LTEFDFTVYYFAISFVRSFTQSNVCYVMYS